MFTSCRIVQIVSKVNYTIHFQVARKEKFLVYNVKEGWGPLCAFLGEEVPDTPFPHKNKGGDIVKVGGFLFKIVKVVLTLNAI